MAEDRFASDNDNSMTESEDSKNSVNNESRGNENNKPDDEEILMAVEATQAKNEATTKAYDEQSDFEQVVSSTEKKKRKPDIYQITRVLCILGFVVFSGLFINEVVIQPIRIKNSINATRELYNKPSQAPIVTVVPSKALITEIVPTKEPEIKEATPTPDPNRDEQGRLLQFKDLLAINEDVKGWITIPDTNIDYVVMQSSKDDPDYYLSKDIYGEYSKAGTLYLDFRSSVETNTKNLVIHGHNMVSTSEKMFHRLLDYKKLSFYKERPVFTFDTIYNTGQWKIFAVFISNGSSKKEPLFDYRQSTFKDASEFLNFIYQIRIRSLLNIDTVDINENDQIITLSTCSYEVDDYRTVIVARKVRDGEDPWVDVDRVTKNKTPLYPQSYYKKMGGEAPKLTPTFEEAYEKGEINWYLPSEDKSE